MEKKRQIKIIKEIDYNSPALPGKPMSLKAFRAWIAEREKSPTISLKEFQRRWAEKVFEFTGQTPIKKKLQSRSASY